MRHNWDPYVNCARQLKSLYNMCGTAVTEILVSKYAQPLLPVDVAGSRAQVGTRPAVSRKACIWLSKVCNVEPCKNGHWTPCNKIPTHTLCPWRLERRIPEVKKQVVEPNMKRRSTEFLVCLPPQEASAWVVDNNRRQPSKTG